MEGRFQDTVGLSQKARDRPTYICICSYIQCF